MTTWAPTSRFLAVENPEDAPDAPHGIDLSAWKVGLIGTRRARLIAHMSAAGIPDENIEELLLPEPRMEAAERLARLVKNIEAPDDHDRVVAVGRLSPPAGQMSTFGKEEIEEEAQRIAWARKAPLCRNLLVDEAKRVLGEQ